MIRLKNDAETMIPPAKPESELLSRSLISSFKKKTQAAPSVVPNNGIRIPIMIFSHICVHSVFLKRYG